MAKILVVDDRAVNRRFLATLLSYAGHQVTDAADGNEALARLREDRHDLVITDILMPNMDGIEFTRQIRADAATAHIPVIFYTATYREAEAKKLAAQFGVQAVLNKPAEPQRILDTVAQFVGAPLTPVPAGGLAALEPPRKTVEHFTGSLGDLVELERGLLKLIERSQRLVGSQGDLRKLSAMLAEEFASLQTISLRFSALIELGLQLASHREPAKLVERFCRGAQDILSAQCVAVGMLDGSGVALEHLAVRGMDERARTAFGGLLPMEGVLGQATKDGKPLRRGQRRGRPAQLVAPVSSPQRCRGWIYFEGRVGGGDFSEEDERFAATLAAQFATAYENLSLYDEIQRHAAQLHLESAERRRAQQLLASSEAALKRAQLMAKLAHVITGADGSFESWSETLPQLAGVGPAEVPAAGRQWLQLLHADDRALFRAKCIEAGATQQRTEVEYRLLRGDGSMINVRQVMERLGGDARWFNTLQDITDQKRAENQLRDSEEVKSAILSSSLDALVTIDHAGRIVEFNPAAEAMFGVSRGQALGQRMVDLIIPPRLREAHQRGFARYLATGGGPVIGKRLELQAIRPDGAEFPIELAITATGALSAPMFTGFIRDITARKEAEEKIKRLNRVYAVLSGINALIVRAQNRAELFREACRIAVEVGRFPKAWIGMVQGDSQAIEVVASEGATESFLAGLAAALGQGNEQGMGIVQKAVRQRTPVVLNDMEHDPVAIQTASATATRADALASGSRAMVILPLVVGEGVAGVLVLHAEFAGFFDDSEMKLLQELAGDIAFALDHLLKTEQLDYLAYYDPITGLANRRLFLQRLEQRLLGAHAAGGKKAVFLLDIERFKTVNDAYGRQAGDALLKQVAERMVSLRGEASRFARIGADTFAIVAADAGSEEQVGRYVEQQLNASFGPPFRVGGHEMRIGAKVGISMFPGDGADADSLLRNAESALKKAKATGDRYVFYAEEMTLRVAERLSLETKLRKAIEREEFVLHYQPKVDLEARKMVGLEALIRWRSPELGLVAPLRFIPLLEETGLILPVGAWALKRAALDHRSWTEQKLNPPRVAVNVSQIQLRQRDFLRVVDEAIIDGVAPTGIDLEITESLIMEDVRASIEKLTAVRGLGVRIAIDDFGTGYSSLGYLAKLPVHALKIDRSFISQMHQDPNAMTLVSTIISLAHSLRLKVIAEGVETEDQAKFLRLLRCDEMQGYLVSKAVPADEVVALLRKARP
jgi:diguanylate cyclase (GGDEF)-like protein/PAS domain S-box-containing protein